jgi:PIN domain nuclease of toxin-antitoxin system
MIDSTAMSLVVHQAIPFQWARDPFDRLITAQAAIYDCVLLSKDETIRKHYAKAV